MLKAKEGKWKIGTATEMNFMHNSLNGPNGPMNGSMNGPHGPKWTKMDQNGDGEQTSLRRGVSERGWTGVGRRGQVPSRAGGAGMAASRLLLTHACTRHVFALNSIRL